MRVFKEEQRFTQTWLIVLLGMTMLPVLILISKTYLANRMSLLNALVVIGFVLIATGFIFICKLKTRIDDIGIHYQFFPFHFKMKTIFWKNVKDAKVRQYNPLTEYGGWGIKGGSLWKKANGIAYNVKGNIGIQLILNDNKKILIGTQNKTDANNTIDRYLHKKNYG
jgi:hypothetical protein